MPASQLITVFGATGAQGGSVIASLLQNKSGQFAIRAVTRNPDSDSAKALNEKGVEVVKADGLIKSEMIQAFSGQWPSSGTTEFNLGKIIVDAAIEAGVVHFVYSGLASATEVTNGQVPSLCFDHKHAISEYAKSQPEFSTVTIVSPGWYTDNHLSKEMSPFMGGFPFIPDDEGYLTLRFPRFGGTDELPFIGIESDFGDIVHGIFLQPQTYDRQLVQALSQSATPEEFVATFQQVTGKKSRFVPIEDWKTMETYGDSLYNAIKEMFGFCQVSGGLYYGVPNDTVAAQYLKAAAAEAKGKPQDIQLETLYSFVSLHFNQ